MNHEDLHKVDLIPIGTGVPEQLDALSLVLSAVGIDYWHDHDTGQLLVTPDDAQSALFHLNQYRQENRNWPPPRTPRQPLSGQAQPTLPMMLLLALFFLHTGQWSAGSNWFTQGAIDSAAILKNNEWWRLITALTLHADLSHFSATVSSVAWSSICWAGWSATAKPGSNDCSPGQSVISVISFSGSTPIFRWDCPPRSSRPSAC